MLFASLKAIFESRAFQGLLFGFYLIYFLKSVWISFSMWFSSDDLMNLHYYWSRSWPELIQGNILFFTDYYRPAGGLFYRGIYDLCGFNPLPFRIIALIFVCLNLALLWRFVQQMTHSISACLLALALIGMNASLFSLYFDSGMIYDVLAYTFYFAALTEYIRIRNTGRIPDWKHCFIIVVLLIFAMNSKEIAVTFPVVIGLYELIWFSPSSWNFRALMDWAFAPQRRIVLLSGLTVSIFVAGMYLQKDSLLLIPAYRTQWSLGQYLETYAAYMMQIFYQKNPPSPLQMAGILITPPVIAGLFRNKLLLWVGLVNFIAILPVAFIPVRNAFTFYIPATFWAITLIVLIFGLLDFPLRLGSQWLKNRRQEYQLLVRFIFVCGIAMYLLPLHQRKLHYPLLHLQDKTLEYRNYMNQIRDIVPEIQPETRILILNDPFNAESYEMYFLTRLMYGDSTITVDQLNKSHTKERSGDRSSYHYVINFVDDRFVGVPSVKTPEI